MPEITKAEFTRLLMENPDASNEEILAIAQQGERSAVGKAWDFVKTPLTDAPSRLAKQAGDYLDTRELGDEKELAFGLNKGHLKGFAAGALQGAGDLVSGFTSPLDLALTALGVGGAKAGAKGLLGISKGARQLEAGLQAPLAAEGVYNVGTGIAEGDYAKAGMGAIQGAGAGIGMKVAGTHSFPPAKVREAYMQSKGRENVQAPKVEKLDPEFSKATADAYDAMPHAPEDPAVAAAYKAMGDETSDQFMFLRDQAGVKMEPWTAEGQPYANSAEMMADVQKNNRLFYFPSEGGFGSTAAQGGNPLLQQGKSGIPINDEFRASHDYFGHAVEGNQFGPLGEERAYQAHRTMFPEDAVPALTTETRGQNSWVNSGAHLRDEAGNIPKKGEPGFVPPQNRPFAEQKTGLLPEEFQVAAPKTQADPSSTSRGSAQPASGIEGASSAPAYTPDDAARNIAALHSEHGGSTFNLAKGPLGGTPHYAVSIHKGREVKVPGKNVSPEQMQAFMAKNADLLQDPDNSVGTWFNQEDGNTYIDVSKTVPGLDDALKLARENDQLAIFDLQNFEEIKTPASGLTGAAPVAKPLAGNVAPEFHAVDQSTAPPAQGLKSPEGAEVIPFAGKSKVATEKAKLDAYRADAAEKRQAAGSVAGNLSSTAMAVAAPAAAMAISDDPDSQWDDIAKVVLGVGSVAALGHAGLSPKMVASLQKVFKQAPTESKGFTLVRNHLKKVYENKPEKAYEFLQRFMAKDVPSGGLEGIDLSQRTPLLKGVVKTAKVVDKTTGKTRTEAVLTPNTTKRLDALFEHAKTLGADWTKDGVELAKLIPDDEERRMFTRAFAALSPTTPLELNFLQTAIAYPMLRAGASPQDVLQALKNTPGHGMGNPGAKLGNLKRAAEGENLSGEKVQALDKGVFGKGDDEVPLDIHFLRALGAIEEKPPSKLLYQAINRAISKYAMEKHGLGAFDYMAPIWGAMRQLSRGDAGSGVAQLMKKVGLDQPSMFTGNPLARFKPEDFPGAQLGANNPAAKPAIDPQVLRALMYAGKEQPVKPPTPLRDAKKAGQKSFDFKTEPKHDPQLNLFRSGSFLK
jgi:hypothetical protein